MQQLRVLCPQGPELFLTLKAHVYRIQVIELKRKMIVAYDLYMEEKEEEEKLLSSPKTTRKRKRANSIPTVDSDDRQANSYVLFRGMILADGDYFDLNSLMPSDFFVFVLETKRDELEAIQPKDGQKKIDPEHIKQLKEMGFDAIEAENALIQTQYNLSNAISLLMGEELDDVNSQTFVPPELQHLLIALQVPEVHQLKELASKNRLLEAYTLIKGLPTEILKNISENGIEFLRFLEMNEGVEDKITTQTSSAVLHVDHQSEDEEKEEKKKEEQNVIDIDQPQVQQEELVEGVGGEFGWSLEETRSIERLKQLGFDPDTVLAVYLSCDKNEQLTANRLLDMI